MNARLNAAMLEATRLTRAGQLLEATEIIKRTFSAVPETPPAARGPLGAAEVPIEGEFYVLDGKRSSAAPGGSGPKPGAASGPKATFYRNTPWPGMGLEALNEPWPGFRTPSGQPSPVPKGDPLPEGARFISASYNNAAGSRGYKLYVPSGYEGQALPLVVMLHGCTQNPDDFAAGTRMNELAEKQPCLVLYPAQSPAANQSKCWNWFKATDQQRERGEPSIIAGMTREVCATHAVDPRRIYIAGLSAGGAMAVTMGMLYPELYAAVGIHSGLPHAAARDLPSALAAMQGKAFPAGAQAKERSSAQPLPAIVFHGDRDNTVNACNGDQIIAQCANPSSSSPPRMGADPRITVERGRVLAGHAYTRSIHRRVDGQLVGEHWLIHGAGHAWAGGSSNGSYTDPKGPDATGQMMRFFLEHPRPKPAA